MCQKKSKKNLLALLEFLTYYTWLMGRVLILGTFSQCISTIRVPLAYQGNRFNQWLSINYKPNQTKALECREKGQDWRQDWDQCVGERDGRPWPWTALNWLRPYWWICWDNRIGPHFNINCYVHLFPALSALYKQRVLGTLLQFDTPEGFGLVWLAVLWKET